MFEKVDPEAGFTSAVIKDPQRFVGRRKLVESSMRAVGTASSLIAVFGKRGVGKSSLLRQVQTLATGDYELARRAGLHHLVPEHPKRYYTVFYTCDSSIADLQELLLRICTDSDPIDGLLRLVPHKGKELVEFSRSNSDEAALDLKVLKWGSKGEDAEKYSSSLRADTIQTFRNFCSSILQHNNRFWKKRDGVLICIDEFDVIQDKSGIGSLIKSLSSERLKFAISGISDDLTELIADHESVDRLIEQGYAHVRPMDRDETGKIFETAQRLFNEKRVFQDAVVERIFEVSMGYPYFVQLIGKRCVEVSNSVGHDTINTEILDSVLDEIAEGTAFPAMESKYQRAIGDSEARAILLTLLAEEEVSIDEVLGGISLKKIRTTAQELEIEHMDQLVPRLIDKKFGPALVRKLDQRGTYEFLDPVFRAYVRMRR